MASIAIRATNMVAHGVAVLSMPVLGRAISAVACATVKSDVYSNNLENRHLAIAKASSLTDCKSHNISNIKGLTIDRSRGFRVDQIPIFQVV